MSLMPFSHISPHHYVRFLFLVLHYLLRPPPACPRRPSPLYQLIPISTISINSALSAQSAPLGRCGCLAWQVRRFLPWLEPSLTQFELVWTRPWTIYLSVCLPICLSFFYLLLFYLSISIFISIYREILWSFPSDWKIRGPIIRSFTSPVDNNQKVQDVGLSGPLILCMDNMKGPRLVDQVERG